MYLRLDPIASGKYIDIFVHAFTTCLLCKILNTLEKNVNFWKILSFNMSPNGTFARGLFNIGPQKSLV